MPVNSRPQHSCLFGSVLHKKSNNCGKAEQKAVSRAVGSCCTHTLTQTIQTCTLCWGLWGVSCHFLFPIPCHKECFICTGRLICLDLGLWLATPRASVCCSCLVVPASSSLLLYCFIDGDSTQRPAGFIAEVFFFFFYPLTLQQLIFHSHFFFSFRLLDLTLPLSSHQRRPWLW